MQAVRVRHYLERAKDFLTAMMFLQDDEGCLNSAALLAIHSAVSYTDALRAGLGEEKLSSDDHRSASSALEGLLSARQMVDRRGVAHLRFLMSQKNVVSYGEKNISVMEYQNLVTKAERFAGWANRVGSQLEIEGWSHDDQ